MSMKLACFLHDLDSSLWTLLGGHCVRGVPRFLVAVSLPLCADAGRNLLAYRLWSLWAVGSNRADGGRWMASPWQVAYIKMPSFTQGEKVTSTKWREVFQGSRVNEPRHFQISDGLLRLVCKYTIWVLTVGSITVGGWGRFPLNTLVWVQRKHPISQRLVSW